MSTSRRVVKNTLFLYSRTIVSLLVSVFTTRILLQSLGESDYGLYNVIGGTIALLGFLQSSMSGATQRFLSYAEGEGNRKKIVEYFNNSVIIHDALAGVMVILYIGGAFIFFNGVLNIPEGKGVAALCIYGCLMVSSAFAMTVVPYDAEIVTHEHMFFYSIIGITDVLAKFGIAVAVMYFNSDKLIFYAVLMAVESVLLMLATREYCRRKYSECRNTELRKYASKRIIKEMLGFSGWNLINVVSGMLSLYGMNILNNHFFGTRVNAAMGIATMLSGIMMSLSSNLMKAVTPVLMKSEGGGEHEKMLKMSYISCRYSYLVFALACFPVLMFIRKILSVWLTEVPYWAPVFCTIMIVAALVEQLTFILQQSIMAEGRVKGYHISRALSNIMPLVLTLIAYNIWELPPYFPLLLWLLFYPIVGGVINLVFGVRNLGLNMPTYFRTVFVPLTITSLLLYISTEGCHYLCIRTGINELIGLATAWILAAIIIWFTAFTREEKEVFTGMVAGLLRHRNGK